VPEAAVAEPDVVAKGFIAKSEASKRALKSANILKSLKIDILIEGEEGVGKMSLARIIAPAALVVDVEEEEKFFEIFYNINDEVVIIKNFHKILDLDRFYRLKEHKNLRVIATSNKKIDKNLIDKIFGIRIYLPPLKEREEDILPLAKFYLKEAKEVLLLPSNDNFFENFTPDLSLNGKSLKKSIYKKLLIENMQEEDVVLVLENYFERNLDEKRDYRYFLTLFDLAIIKAGLKKFKSQLKLSKILGLNRNTLRKKINEIENLL